jgi:leader peptidase (prepilin peptidase)/N-methyltransferase
MLAAFIAASAIDLERWIIPLSICWLVTAVGFVGSTAGAYVIDPALIKAYSLLPVASPTTGALALGAAIGLGISLALLATGLLKRSYESDDGGQNSEVPQEGGDAETQAAVPSEGPLDQTINHRLEACREIIFLLPVVICSYGTFWLTNHVDAIGTWWTAFSQHPAVAGLLGSVWGYVAGCGIVWSIRIFGTLAFGKEAMGLGDVHLMGAAGAVIGAFFVVLAFFIAPFFGLAWAGGQMFFKKIRQIPYGPFLSLGIFVVMIFHDLILNRIGFIFYR